MTTKVTYAFPSGFDRPLVTIPFRYAMKEHISVLIDEEQLKPNQYTFETAGTIRLDIKKENAVTVTVRRMTRLSENSPLAQIVMALEESRDAEAELRAEADTLRRSTAAKVASVANNLTAKISEARESTLFEAGTALENAKLAAANLENIVAAALALENEKRAELQKHTNERTDAIGKRMDELWRLLDERTVFLSRAISAAFDTCRAETDNIRIDVAEMAALPAAVQAQAAPVALNMMPASYDGTHIISLEETLAQTRTALNSETQTRRREDAQLKSLIKHLLQKYERVEDYLAGNDENFPQSVIRDLRAELLMQDDKLGRTLLTNIVQIEMLKNTLRNED